MHCTCAALPVVTALLRSGESNGLTNAIEERRTRVDAKLAVLAIDAQRDRDRALDVRASAISATEALSALVLLPCAGTDAPMPTAAAVVPVLRRNSRRVGFEGSDFGSSRIKASVRMWIDYFSNR